MAETEITTRIDENKVSSKGLWHYLTQFYSYLKKGGLKALFSSIMYFVHPRLKDLVLTNVSPVCNYYHVVGNTHYFHNNNNDTTDKKQICEMINYDEMMKLLQTQDKEAKVSVQDHETHNYIDAVEQWKKDI